MWASSSDQEFTNVSLNRLLLLRLKDNPADFYVHKLKHYTKRQSGKNPLPNWRNADGEGVGVRGGKITWGKTKVTRLGKLSPIGWLFTYVGYFFQNYTSTCSVNLWSTFPQCISYIFNLTKKRAGLHFGRLFHKLIWSPWARLTQEEREKKREEMGASDAAQTTVEMRMEVKKRKASGE
jgi:hypothetical protein